MNITEFERLSKIFFESTNQNERILADKELKIILNEQNSVIPIFRFLFKSESYQVQHLSLLLLRDLVTRFWMKLEQETQQELQGRLINYISLIINTKYRELFTPATIVFSRIVKFGLPTDSKLKKINLVDSIQKEFFENNKSSDILIGLYLLTNLVTECNTPISPWETIIHHRLFLSWFRDEQLFSIFNLAANYLRLSTVGIDLNQGFNSEFTTEISENEQKFNEQNKNYFNNNENDQEEIDNYDFQDQNIPLKIFDSSLELILSILTFNFYFVNTPQDLDTSNTYTIRIPIKWCRNFKFKCTQILPSLIKQYLETSKHYNASENNNNNSSSNNLNSVSLETIRLSKILKCFSLLASVHSSLFIGNNQLLKQFLRYLLGSVLLISNNQDQLNQEDTLKIGFSQLNQKIIINWSFRQLGLSGFLENWLETIFECTIENLQINKINGINSNVIYYLASFWGNAATKSKKDLNNTKGGRSNYTNNSRCRGGNNNGTQLQDKDKLNLTENLIELFSLISKKLIQIKIEQLSNKNINENDNFERSIEDLFLPKSSFLSEIKVLRDLVRIEYPETQNFIVTQFDNYFQNLQNNNINEETILKISGIIIIFSNLISRFQVEINLMKKQESKKTKNRRSRRITFMLEANNNRSINNNNTNKGTGGIEGEGEGTGEGEGEGEVKGKKEKDDNFYLCGKLDIELIYKVIELIKWNEDLFIKTNQNERYTSLELSILYFLKKFLNVYHPNYYKKSNTFYKYLIEFIPDFKNEQDIFIFLFVQTLENMKTRFIHLNLILESLKFLRKLINPNIWPKKVFNSEPILNFLSNHNEGDFPFLKSLSIHSSDKKIRILFYRCLTKLMVAEEIELNFLEKFENFLNPFEVIFLKIKEYLENNNSNNNNQNNNEEIIEEIFIFLFNFRGIFIEMSKSKYFVYLYDWLFPDKIKTLNLIFENFWHTWKVTNSILQLWIEFVKDNNEARLLDEFVQVNENKTNLFIRCKFCLQILSKFIQNYFSNIKFGDIDNNSSNVDREQYIKTLKLCFVLLKRIIKSLQANLGIFECYQDDTLNNSILSVLSLLSDFPHENLLIYPKLSKAYYSLLLTLTKEKMSIIINLNSSVFDLVFSTINIGLNSRDKKIFKKNCQILEKLLRFYFKNYNNKFTKNETKKELALIFHNVLLEYQDDLISIMGNFFQLVIYENEVNTWVISSSLLVLICLFQNNYMEIKNTIIDSIDDSQQGMEINNLFEQLMKPIENDLTSVNKYNFAHNLSIFRKNIRETGFLF
ncbi:exportin 47-related [Anaeramoeba flamelloides]|uniref:Exportin 47-related n=1 Tax=Anaeramoeba flamelloides TaxID=1746091 RepID=A0AAV7YFJ2_9EUKA|nr:exportin 47-related [Anaeramoeba flamelloides]